MANIREELACELYRQKMSYEKLAMESGVHRNTCYRVLNCNKNTTIDTVAAMADALGLELVLAKKVEV